MYDENGVYLQTGEIGQEREGILLDLTNEIGAQIPAEKGGAHQLIFFT